MSTSETYNIDCMEYMSGIDDNYFELAIVDPPYRDENKPTKWMKDISDMDSFGKKPTKEYFQELFRISKNQIIWGANNFNLEYQGFVVWDKNIRGSKNYSWCEIASLSNDLSTTSIICKIPISEKGLKIHPTQKPVALYKWLLQNYAKKGDKIFDSHLGSGSSRIAAYELGFDFYATELDKDYFNDQELRFKEWKMKFENKFYIPDDENNLFKGVK
jgi:site-specific DNA-methyltransferase (adenine-specific)